MKCAECGKETVLVLTDEDGELVITRECLNCIANAPEQLVEE